MLTLVTRRASLVSILAGIALAQNDRGVITGTVSGPGGAVAPSAKLELRNVATGAAYARVSTGGYDLTITAPGFRQFIREGIGVRVAQTERIDVVLTFGANSVDNRTDLGGSLRQGQLLARLRF